MSVTVLTVTVRLQPLDEPTLASGGRADPLPAEPEVAAASGIAESAATLLPLPLAALAASEIVAPPSSAPVALATDPEPELPPLAAPEPDDPPPSAELEGLDVAADASKVGQISSVGW